MYRTRTSCNNGKSKENWVIPENIYTISQMATWNSKGEGGFLDWNSEGIGGNAFWISKKLYLVVNRWESYGETLLRKSLEQT